MRLFKVYLRHTLRDMFDRAFDPEQMGLTEDQLAKRAKLHPNTLYRLRTGRTQDPRLQTIWKLARAVGWDVKLLGEELAEVAEME